MQGTNMTATPATDTEGLATDAVTSSHTDRTHALDP